MAPDDDDVMETLKAQLLGSERAVPTSRIGRLLKTGRTGLSLATAVLRRRGEPDRMLDAAELEAASALVKRLGELKGVAMKMGQVLGYVDVAIPAEMRRALSVLQTSAQASPWPEVEATVRAALGDKAAPLLAGLERAPVAVASIGQVHRGHLPGGEAVAVKVRHPGIEEALIGDFKAAGAGSAFAALVAPGAGVKGFIDEAKTALLEECDYLLEASRQEEFGRLFAADPVIRVPRVVREYCARAVLTTAWLPGRSLEDVVKKGAAQAERDRIGEALFRFYVGTLYRHGLFHADPHPGNCAVRDDGTLVFYDFGCVRRFDAPTVRALAALVAALRADDTTALRTALEQLGAKLPRDPERAAHVRTLLRAFFAPVLVPGVRAVAPGEAVPAGQLMADKRAALQLGLPGRLLFLFRLRFGLFSVLARLGARADWAGLEAGWATDVKV